MNDFNKNIAIAVVAFNRPRCLQRILNDLNHAKYDSNNIQLIISIDQGYNQDVLEIAEDFKWNHGEKHLIIKEKHLGLKRHILSVGDLTNYYDNLIVLEDDLIVAQEFYLFAVQSLPHLLSDENVFGVSLYSYRRTEHNYLPFCPTLDGNDNYFMKLAGSWGQLWTKDKWQGFKTWLHNAKDNDLDKLPSYMRSWPESSWKKWLTLYLMESNLYYSFPRISYTSNIGENGEHGSSNRLYEVPLALNTNWKEFKYSKLTDSKAIYDSWFELKPSVIKSFNTDLVDFDFTTDLYGTKEKKDVPTEYVLSAFDAGSLRSYSGELSPVEANIMTNRKGRDFYLSQTKLIDFDTTRPSIQHENAHALVKASLLAGDAYLSLTVLIIVKKENVEQLATSFSSLLNQSRKVNILVAYEKELKKSVNAMLCDHHIEAFEYDQSTVINEVGLRIKTDLFTWVNSGMSMYEKTAEYASKVFSSSRWISVVMAVKNDVDVKELRLSKYNISKLSQRGLSLSTESMVLRSHVLKQVSNDKLIKLDELFPAIMQVADLHLLIQQWYKASLESVKYLNTAQSFNSKNRKLSLLKRLSLPLIKKLGKEHLLFNVPDVLYYDNQNDSYFLSKS